MKNYSAVTKKVMQRRRIAAPLYDWVGAMVAALVALVLIFSFVARIVGVDGDSMVPTLNDRDRLLLYSIGVEYRYGDIVVINRSTNDPLVKRVIGVPGDTLDIDEFGHVYRNGERLNEPYIQGVTVKRDFTGPVTVPEGYLFVMGDNRSISKDSRSAEIGFVYQKNVLGKVILRIWPFSDFGAVYSNLESNL